MRFKVGDKVNFLNEQGGGTVKAIIDSKLVKVETDDGFEVPVLTIELIRDFRAQPLEEEIFPISMPTAQKAPTVDEPEEDRISEVNPWGTVREESGIYLAFEPHDQQWLLTGDIDIFLINQTPAEILYSLFFRQNESLQGVDFGSVPAKSKINIETIGRDEIEDWCNGYIQILFHNDQPKQLYMPVHSVIDLKPSRFFKEGSYQQNSLLQGRALILSIAPESTLQKVSGSEYEQKYDIKGISSQSKQITEKAVIDKHKKALGQAEVDLHIGELLDNIAGLSNHDMLNAQVNYFKKCLESAIKNDYHKVTFIHGVGNGVLKNALIKELEEYAGTENRMASISKFGVGAIDVLIKSKE